MKTNFKRIGKQSISIVLAVMMMLSTMLVGMVTSNAADQSTTLYFAYSGSYDVWPENWGGTGNGNWYQATAVSGKTFEGKQVYSCNLYNDSKGANLHFKQGNKVTGDISDIIKGESNGAINNYTSKIYVVNDAGNGGEWKDYSTSTTTHNVTANFSNATVKLGNDTLTSGTPKTVDNNTDYTLTVKPDEGYTLTSVKFGDTEKDTIGTYTYNGSSDTTITITTEPTTPASDIVVYFANPVDNGWGTVCNYIWNTSNAGQPKKDWPGEPFKDSDVCQKDYSYKNVTYKVYKVTVPAAYNSIIFNNGSNSKQTGNIQGEILADRNLYIYNQISPTANVDIIKNYTEPTTNTKHSVTYTPPTGEGVVSASIDPTETTLAAGLAEGTNVTVTVTVNDGYTASLAVDGATVTTSTSGNIYTFKFTMPAKDITVAPQVTKAGENTGTEIQGLYLIYGNTSNNPNTFTDYTKLYVDSSNQVFAYFTSGKNLDTKKQYYFLISTTHGDKSYQQAYNDPHNNRNYAFNDEKYNDVVTTGYSQFNIDETSYYAGTFTVKEGYRDTVSSVKINLGYYKDGIIQENATNTTKAFSYEVIPTSGAEGMVQVFAKDGTIRKQIVNSELVNFQKYADMADTVLENGADLTKYDNTNEYYESASAKVGTKLKIKTTILPKYREKYFVKAFSINGYSYGIIDASKADKQNGVYNCEYTIPEDFEGKRIEITPIYYYIDDTDTVTFYVEGFDAKVQEMWGNTIAVQAWYKNGVEGGESGSDTKNALGGYPGQPLVYQGGKYSMQIPKCLNDNTDNTVQGITLNNYFWDDIHKKSFTDQSDKYNCQTYDFNDFYKLSETPDVDNIIFDFRYKTTKDNEPSTEGLSSSKYNPDELENLTDYYGNIVNIFGNFLSEDWKEDYKSNHLTVISNGYVPITGIGNYATEWSVYAPDGTYITTINCSSLINENKVDTDDYTVAYNKLKQYKDLPVQIAYEMSLYGGGDKGTRADGRWYFSKKAHTISANVTIQYKEDGSTEFKDDIFKTDSNEGTETGAKACFTNADYSGKTTCKGTVDGGNFSVHAETDANAKYYFLGWYLKTSDGYSFITNESDADFPMTNNETYVARFIPTPSGTLTLSHTLLTGSADGKTFIKANIVDSEGNVKASIAETSGNLVIPSSYVNYASEYKIVATLKTVPYGKDEVEGFYNSDKKRYDYAVSGTGEKTYEVSTTIKELFEEIENTDGSVSHNLKKSNIPFYSNIKSNPINYQITYVYFTRLDDQQIYVIKDTVSGIELEEMWAANEAAGLNKEQLSKAFITKKAPFVSNYREEITWDMDHAIIDHDYTATVFSNTKPVNPKISALTVAGSWTLPTEVEYGTLAKSNGDYLYKTGTNEFPEKFNYSGTTEYEFSFWAIFDNIDEAKKYSDAVKAYMLDAPAADMSQRLTALTELDGYKNLITKSYSKKYNYVSYQDYYIVPVYAGRFANNEIKESQASIRLLEYTRNQWTDGTYGVNGNGIKNEGGSKTDYLYTDFALSFDKDQLLIKDNTDIKVGVAFEIVAKYDPVKPRDSYLTDSNPDEIRNLVKTATDSDKPKGRVGAYEMNGASRSVYRYEIDNSKISEKNRIEYYLRFNNTKNAQQNVMKVYSYIYDTVSGEVFLSDPEYMNMYDIGNLTYITSGLANINLGSEATV